MCTQVDSERLELLKHPIVTNLLDYKWRKYGRTVYFIYFSTYLLLLVFLTAFGLWSPTPRSYDCELKFLVHSNYLLYSTMSETV